MKHHYDLIFSVGRTCVCSQALRKANLQLASFPFDWLGDPTVYERVEHICNDFKDWPKLEDLDWRQTPKLFDNKPHVFCRRTGLFFFHDFKYGLSIAEQYPQFAEKYARRIKRLQTCIESSRRVLIVSIGNPFHYFVPSIEECRRCRKAMAERFKGVDFDFLLMTIDEGRKFKDRIEEEVEEGLFHVAYDYRKLPADRRGDPILLDQVGAYLASRFSVRDYRTDEEKKAHAEKLKRIHEQKRQLRMAKLGAKTMWQYEFYRLRKFFRTVACTIGPRELLACSRRKKFAQIVFLGVNCEAAFRFLRRWGFVDSSLFAWAGTTDIPTLSAAIDALDDLPTGPFTLSEHTHVWKSVDTDTYYHGKLKWDDRKDRPTAEDIDNDLADLRGRLGYLVEKFKRYLSNEEKTLLVLKLSDEDAASDDMADRLCRLESALARRKARNCALLIVCRRADLCRMPPEKDGLFIRCVREFNSNQCATMAETGDPVAWHAIFTEFAPEKILPKAHAFKFE